MTIPEYIAHLRAKPEHVRTRIAIGTTSAVTGVVALAWVLTLAATGAFSLAPLGTPAPVLTQAAPTESGTNFSQLLGAVNASFSGGTSSAPTLVITDSGTASTLDRTQPAPEARVIPF